MPEEKPLTDGATYAWHVQAYDEGGPGPWSSWCGSTVDATHPHQVPTVFSREYPGYPDDLGWHGGPGIPGKFTFSALGDSDVVKFRSTVLGGVRTVIPADRPGEMAIITFTPDSGVCTGSLSKPSTARAT